MQIKNTSTSYGVVSKSFHWVLAVLIIGLLAVGLYMTDMQNSPSKFELYGLHKSTGLVALILVMMRFIWKVRNETPGLPDAIPPLQKIASRAAHAFLYIAMFVMPLSGWGMSSAGGHKVTFYGLFEVPPLVPQSKMLGGILHETHELLANVLIVVLVVHVLAAFLHHFWYKDGVLKRMTWGK